MRRRVRPRFDDLEPTLLGEQARIDQVHGRVGDRLKQALDGGGGQDADVALRDLAAIADFGRAQVIVGELRGELAQHHHQPHIRLEHVDILWPQAGRIDGKLRRTPLEHGQDFVGHLSGDIGLGFDGRGAQVGRGHDLGVPGQRIVGCHGLGREHVDAGAAEAAFVQGGQQRRLVHQSPARAVDDERARAHARDTPGTQDAAGGFGQRHVQ